MRPQLVLTLGAVLVAGMLFALWLTSAAPPLPAAPDVDREEATAPPAERHTPPASPRVTPPPERAGPAIASTPEDAGVVLRPGVNAPLPVDQWPEQLRPTTRTVQSPPPEDTPAVRKEDIRAAIENVKPLIARCFTDAAAKNRGDQKVVLKFTIQGQGTSGSFQDGEVVESSIVDPWVQACFLEALTDARFPAPAGGGTVTVTYPFSFVDDEGDAGTDELR